jgi:molybdopterin/thiamine biosynthesis adenylyltransferase
MGEIQLDYSRLDGTVFSRDRMRTLRVLVVGAGALGNEILKNLCLLGVGKICIIDRDIIEKSNLTRSVLFNTPSISESILSREPKASLAARRIRDINPDIETSTFVGEIADFGLGRIRQFDLIFSALDNEMGRLELSWACTTTDRMLVDGGLGLHNYSSGMISLFPGTAGPCYACGKSSSRRVALLSDLLGLEAPCSERMQQANDAGFIATTPIMASVIGAIQVELGLRSFFMRGEPDQAYFLQMNLHPVPRMETFISKRNSNCPLHESQLSYYIWDGGNSNKTRVVDLIDFVEEREKVPVAFTLRWPIVTEAVCLDCKNTWSPMIRSARFRRNAVCIPCGSRNISEAKVLSELNRDSSRSKQTLSELGLPDAHIHEFVLFRENERGKAMVEVRET